MVALYSFDFRPAAPFGGSACVGRRVRPFSGLPWLFEAGVMMELDNAKDVEIRFRVPAWLKQDFLDMCRRLDVPASYLLRRFVRTTLASRSIDDGFQIHLPKATECPRCACSDLADVEGGFMRCLECRLVWLS